VGRRRRRFLVEFSATQGVFPVISEEFLVGDFL